MEKRFITFVFFLLFGVFASISNVNAQFGAVVDTEDDGQDGGVGGGQTCYSTYNSCTIGCDSTLICDGGGECHREKVDSYSSRGDC